MARRHLALAAATTAVAATASSIPVAPVSTGSARPTAEGALADHGEQADRSASSPDLTTVEGLRSYLESVGITTKRVEQFAAARGMSPTGYYEAVLKVSDGDGPPPFPVEYVDGKIRYKNSVDGATGFKRSEEFTQAGRKDSGDVCSTPSRYLRGHRTRA